MRVCYFYAKPFEKAIAALPSDAEHVYTGGSDTAYWEEIDARWGKIDDDLLFVEQDIVISDEVIPAFEACEQPRCMFAYLFGNGKIFNTDPLGSNFITGSLGCTRFSKAIQKQVPLQAVFDFTKDFINPMPQLTRSTCPFCPADSVCWRHIDESFNLKFRALKNVGHVHGFVENLHYDHLPEPAPGIEVDEDPEWVEMVL
jgi:hypothetical protein